MNSPFRQKEVAQAHLMVVGCGALGNEVLKNLALMGVQHLVLVDFDYVESDNLSHSVLFTKKDAETNRRKVDAASERLKQMNPDINIQTIFGDIAYDVGLGLLRQMDVVIGCVDNRWARYCINRLCMRAGIPWVDGGIDGLEGTARVFMPDVNCYACNLGPEGLKDMAYRMPCAGTIRRNIAAGKAPTTSIAASVIGAIEAQEAMKLIDKDCDTTSLCGKMFYYEGAHLTTKLVDFKAYDDDCPLHERWSPIVPSPLNTQSTVAEVLKWLETTYSVSTTICLGDDCFVDYVVCRSDDSRHPMMKPGRTIATLIEKDDNLRGIPFNDFYQHEWKEIDQNFPYQDLTLSELGIPELSILKIITEQGYLFIELSR